MDAWACGASVLATVHGTAMMLKERYLTVSTCTAGSGAIKPASSMRQGHMAAPTQHIPAQAMPSVASSVRLASRWLPSPSAWPTSTEAVMLNATAGKNKMDSTRSPVVSPARALTLPKGREAVMTYRTI